MLFESINIIICFDVYTLALKTHAQKRELSSFVYERVSFLESELSAPLGFVQSSWKLQQLRRMASMHAYAFSAARRV
jgi:hypothetical protein